jgi:hypothetical protein
VLIAVGGVANQAKSDLFLNKGDYGYLPRLPAIIGTEGVGRIVTVGSAVKTFEGKATGRLYHSCTPHPRSTSKQINVFLSAYSVFVSEAVRRVDVNNAILRIRYRLTTLLPERVGSRVVMAPSSRFGPEC